MDGLRFAIRRLTKQPGATAVSIVTLAIAIGSGVAAWSLLSAVLLRPLPVADPDRLVAVGARGESTRPPGSGVDPLQLEHVYPVYTAVQSHGAFERVAAGGSTRSLVTRAGETRSRTVFFASSNFFETIGVRLQAGRGFTRADDQPGAPPVAILSHRFWQRAFSSSPDALGEHIVVAGQAVTIVGIAPSGFRGLTLAEAPDLYLPLHIVADIAGSASNWFADPSIRTSPTAWIRIMGRIRPGMNTTTASEQLATLPPDAGLNGRTFSVTMVNTAALAEGARPAMAQFARLLAITVSLLFLIGCLTVGMLMLLRTEARRGEFAMCLALGATRTRLALGIALDGGLIAGAGAALALPVSWWLLTGVRAFRLPGGIDIGLLEIPMDGRLLGAGAAAAVTATLVIALVAGGFGVSPHVADALRARSGATPRIGRRRTRAALVITQVAVALVLLTGAGLFARSLAAALSLNPGYDTGRIATASVSLGPYGYTPDRARAFFDDLGGRLIRSPAIRSVAMMLETGGMSGGGPLVIDGEQRRVPSFVAFTGIDERYFSTIGLSRMAGRDFTAHDRAGAPRVAIVSESLGRFLAGGGDPLGHRVSDTSSRMGQPPDAIEIVGVVPDIVTSVTSLQPLVLYMPIAQLRSFPYRTVVVRAAADTSTAVREAVSAIKGMEPALAMPLFTTIDERLARQMNPQQFGATVLGALGGIATLLTLFGIYVLAESMVALRRREMGVRAALGANRWQLSAPVLIETAGLLVAGLALGLVVAWMGGSLIRSLLFDVQPFDPPTLIAVPTIMLVLALAVTLRPALRAGRVDLSRVLREE